MNVPLPVGTGSRAGSGALARPPGLLDRTVLVLDAVARLQEGVLGHPDSAVNESFSSPTLLDCPQYTRPEEFRGWRAPEVLLGGNHAHIRQWREQAAYEKTARLRPDLLDS